MLPSRLYESEHTRFIRELIEKRPDLPERQRAARATWWDRDPRTLGEERERAQGKVPQKPYVYQTD